MEHEEYLRLFRISDEQRGSDMTVEIFFEKCRLPIALDPLYRLMTRVTLERMHLSMENEGGDERRVWHVRVVYERVVTSRTAASAVDAYDEM
jgi:hypothetical protein